MELKNKVFGKLMSESRIIYRKSLDISKEYQMILVLLNKCDKELLFVTYHKENRRNPKCCFELI